LAWAIMLFKRVGSWCGVKFAQLYPYIDQYPIKETKKVTIINRGQSARNKILVSKTQSV